MRYNGFKISYGRIFVMGFWSSFFGAGAAHIYNEMKKEEKETQKWNDNLHMTMNYEEEFSNYLKSIGSNAVYISEVDESAVSVRNQIDRYKRKIKEFLNLGGEGKYIYDVEELDEYIEVMKYLKSVGYVNRQQEFLGLDLFLVKGEIDRVLREDNSSALLVNLKGNILNGIVTKGNDLFASYDDWEESANTIKNGTAKLYSEDTVQFLEYKTISLVFTETNIYIYSYELDEHSQLYCNLLIGENQKLDIASLPIPAVEGWSMVVIDDLQILCANSEAEKVMELYRKHNADIYLEEEMLQQTAAENINQLSGVEFERVCQQLVENMGFETETTKASGDGGIDLLAYNHQPLLSGKYIIQCKRYTGSVGEPIIRDLYGVVMSERANKGILMTTGHFTKSAIAFADGKPLELIDGGAMQNLFSQYGMNISYSKLRLRKEYTDVTNGRNIEEVIQDNFSLEEKYDEFLGLKDVADNTKEEIEIAGYINWLIDKIDSENYVIFDHSERLVFFKEINEYIKKYLDMRKIEKSKLLSYLYQMIYVQNSILLERFTDAKEMFVRMMKNEDIQFNVMETLGETHKTAEIFENTGVFSFLFATWCNMNQLAYISHDDDLRMYLSDHNLFYGIPLIQDGRINDNLELIKFGKSQLNPLYFQKQQKLINELNSIFNDIEMKIFFRIDKTEVVESFYNYSYFQGNSNDIMLEFCDYKIENNEVIINNYGNINIDNALGAYIPFSQDDLLD